MYILSMQYILYVSIYSLFNLLLDRNGEYHITYIYITSYIYDIVK